MTQRFAHQPPPEAARIISQAAKRLRLAADTVETSIVDGNAAMALVAVNDLYDGAETFRNLVYTIMTTMVVERIKEEHPDAEGDVQIAAVLLAEGLDLPSVFGVTAEEAVARWDALCQDAKCTLDDLIGDDS